MINYSCKQKICHGVRPYACFRKHACLNVCTQVSHLCACRACKRAAAARAAIKVRVHIAREWESVSIMSAVTVVVVGGGGWRVERGVGQRETDASPWFWSWAWGRTVAGGETRGLWRVAGRRRRVKMLTWEGERREEPWKRGNMKEEIKEECISSPLEAKWGDSELRKRRRSRRKGAEGAH